MYDLSYFQDDDVLQIKFSDKKICKETSQDWNTHISFAEDGSIVEIVLLDFKQGLNADVAEMLSISNSNVKEVSSLIKN